MYGSSKYFCSLKLIQCDGAWMACMVRCQCPSTLRTRTPKLILLTILTLPNQLRIMQTSENQLWVPVEKRQVAT